MAPKRLYVTDLDGTLLRDDATLSSFSRSTLERMIHAGLQFTVASARSVFSIQEILRGLPIALPIISINGGYISDLKSGLHHHINHISRATAKSLMNLIIDSGHAPWVSTFDGAGDRLYYNQIVNGGMQWYLEDRRAARDTRLKYLPQLDDALSDKVVCLIVMGKAGPVKEIRSIIEQKHGSRLMTQFYQNRYSPGWYWLSIHDAGANKGRALQTIIRQWNLRDREVVVFGDAENDIEMFQQADRAIAVAGAEEALLPHADRIIGPNSEDSVVRFIEMEQGGPGWSHQQHKTQGEEGENR